MRVTAQEKAYANGYAHCFIQERLPDNYDTDYETWFTVGSIDFRLHFDNGLVVVDAYMVGAFRANTSLFQRVFVEYQKVQA
jgi:hypothetical protein